MVVSGLPLSTARSLKSVVQPIVLSLWGGIIGGMVVRRCGKAGRVTFRGKGNKRIWCKIEPRIFRSLCGCFTTRLEHSNSTCMAGILLQNTFTLTEAASNSVLLLHLEWRTPPNGRWVAQHAVSVVSAYGVLRPGLRWCPDFSTRGCALLRLASNLLPGRIKCLTILNLSMA